MEWIKNMSAEAWTFFTVIATTYGGSIVAFLIAYIRGKLKQHQLESTIEDMTEVCSAKIIESTQKIETMVDNKLMSLENRIKLKIDEKEDERNQEVNDAAADFEEALENLKNKTI